MAARRFEIGIVRENQLRVVAGGRQQHFKSWYFSNTKSRRAALLGAKHFTAATQFQVFFGDQEAVFSVFHHLEARLRRLRQAAEADLLLCRDCLVHLSFADIARAIANIRAATVTYLLTTTFPAQRANEDIRTGDWRPLNLEAAPFGWPAPLEYLVEKCTEGNGLFADKSLGLWRVDSLPR